MTTISLLTDFGLRDGNVGVMKGVIWGIAPDAHIADLSHTISPQNVHEASFTLLRSAFYFPARSVHIVVVDPGVGTARKPIAFKIGDQYFVGPDNGVFTGVLEHGEQEGLSIRVVHTDNPSYWRSEISHVFHGRDIFAPVGAHLAVGVPLDEFGPALENPVRLTLSKPEHTPEGRRGEVVHIDHFGNIYTNLRREHLGDSMQISVSLGDVTVNGLVQAFGDRAPGKLVALYSSTDYLMLSEVNGDAGARLNAVVGDLVLVTVNDE
ncbi:MAG: SAM-dependent chlorinase/fluorinase [Chloroflexota bacterium]